MQFNFNGKKEDLQVEEEKDLRSIANEISARIGEAIGVISPYKAPIIVLILENYVEALRKDDHFCEDAYDFVKTILRTEAHVFKPDDPMIDELKKNPDLFNDAQRFVIKPEDL